MDKVIVLNSDSFGNGSEELGKRLLGSFLRKLWGQERKPDAIICYNSGVRLITTGSPVLDVITGLDEAGVEILACGTCIDYFNLRDHIRAGRISNMDEIASVLMSAHTVITV